MSELENTAKNEEEDLLVVGRNTADGKVSAWYLSGIEQSEFEKSFCELLARDTGNTVFVIKGKILRRYRCIEKIPVECVNGNPLERGTADLERKLDNPIKFDDETKPPQKQ